MTYRPLILIKGNTQLIHELRPAEEVARTTTAWLGDDPGRVWHQRGELPDDDPLAAAKGIGLWAIIMLAFWVIGISVVWGWWFS